MTTTQNLWDSVKAVLRGNFIAIQAYLKKQERRQMKNLTLHLNQLEKEPKEKTSKVIRRKEIIKIRAEINEKKMKETIAKINKTKIWFLEKINKINKPLARYIKKKREMTQINKLEMKKEKLQQTMQKYKRLEEIIMNNYMAIKWITWKKWTDS